MRIALAIVVEDSCGYREGLPAILHLLDQYNIRASFFFSLGFDNTGLAIKQLFRPRVLFSQLPWQQKLRGTLLPPRALSRHYADSLLTVDATGHDCGIASFDTQVWQEQAITADERWTRRQLDWAVEAFAGKLGRRPKFHAAAGQVLNAGLLRYESEHQMVGIDCRGRTAFYPEYQGYTGHSPQLPVTLPTIEQLLQDSEVNPDNVHEYLFSESQLVPPQGHLMLVRAAFEGRQWLAILEKLLVMWRGMQWEFLTLGDMLDRLDPGSLSTHQVGWMKAASYPGHLAAQGAILEDK